MSQAVVAQSGRPRELYEAPANLFVADFIGDANLVDAELFGGPGETARGPAGCRGWSERPPALAEERPALSWAAGSWWAVAQARPFLPVAGD